MDFAIGSLAAMAATLFSNPFDLLKTRMQLQGELKRPGQHAIYYKHPFQAAYTVMKKEGIFALQKGLKAALLMHGISNGIKLGTYELFLDKKYICDNQNRIIFYKSLLAGAIGGGLGAFFGTPLYKITTQSQSRAAEEIAVGHQHKLTTVRRSLRATFLKYGVQGLWRGGQANVVRTAVGASVQLTTFVKVKEVLKRLEIFQQSTVLTAIVASISGAVCQSIFQTPFDLISIRLNNQYVDASGRGTLYSGMFNCAYKIWKFEGVLGFYKGVMLNYMKVVRHTTLCLVFWEILKDCRSVYFNKEEYDKY